MYALKIKKNKEKIVKLLNKMTPHDTTRKVEQLRFYKTDDEVCKIIGISKNTLYTRLRQSNWKTSEIYLIERYKL